MASYLARKDQPRLAELLSFFPAVGLVGSRQVGKTTLARQLLHLSDRPMQYFDLERFEDLQRLRQDAGFVFSHFRDHCVVIDEVQQLPELFTVLRAEIDEHRVPGRFLLLGSASPLMLRSTSDSLAGRIAYHTLGPLTLGELPPAPDLQNRHWWRGGYPDAWLAPTDAFSLEWRSQFVRTYVERDLNMMGLRADPVRFRQFLQMLAAVHGQIWNAEGLSRSLGISATTLRTYLDFLEQSFFAWRLQPWFANLGKRLIKSPKVYLLDSGLLHALLGISQPSQLLLHPAVGASWEGYCIGQIRAVLPPGIEPYYYRTADGTECDLLLVRQLTVVACIEIKLSNTPTVSRGFHSVLETLKPRHAWLVTHSSASYPLSINVQVIALQSLVAQIEAGEVEW
jgi:predicted AAA+ superfamily ATPase